MDLSLALSEAIRMIWEDEDWVKILDYEQVPFRCRRCHEYGHLFQECPLNHPKKSVDKASNPVDPSFSKVTACKRGNRKQEHQYSFKKINSSNYFEILGNHVGKSLDSRSPKGNPSISEVVQPSSRLSFAPIFSKDLLKGKTQQEARSEIEATDTLPQSELLDESKDMDIGELYLEGIEKSCSYKVKGYVPQE